MFNWKLNFKHEESVASSELVSLFIEAEFEKSKMQEILNIDGVFSAIGKQGLIPLFTCSCGSFSCGGYYVKVSHLDEGISLRGRYKPVDNPAETDIIESFEYELSWEDLYIIASEVYDKLIKLKELYPGYDVCSGTFGEGVLNKINSYGLLLKELRSKYDD
jgi:hypothetical protein